MFTLKFALSLDQKWRCSCQEAPQIHHLLFARMWRCSYHNSETSWLTPAHYHLSKSVSGILHRSWSNRQWSGSLLEYSKLHLNKSNQCSHWKQQFVLLLRHNCLTKPSARQRVWKVQVQNLMSRDRKHRLIDQVPPKYMRYLIQNKFLGHRKSIHLSFRELSLLNLWHPWQGSLLTIRWIDFDLK